MLNDVINARVVELGKIKIGQLGAKRPKQGKPNEFWRMPEKLDHFVVTTMHRDDEGQLIPDKNLMAQLKEHHKDSDGNVRSIPIQVLSNDIDDIMQSSYCWYSGKKLAGRSDGKILTLFVDIEKNRWLDTPLEVAWNDEWRQKADRNGNRYFKMNTIFNCVISMEGAKFGGIYRFRTTSQITAEQLYSSLMGIRALTNGVLRGLPLRLVVRPVRVNPTMNGNKVSTTVYVVHVELVGSDLAAVRQLAMETARLELTYSKEIKDTQDQYSKLIRMPGWGESAQEQADVQMELYPDHDEGVSPGVDPLAAQLGIVDEPEIDGETIPETTIDDAGNFEPITPAQVTYLTGILANKTNCDKFLKVMLDRWTISAFDKIPVSLFDEIKKAAFDFVKPQEEKK